MIINNKEKIDLLLSPVVKSMGYDYVGSEFLYQGRFSTLIVYIDKKEGVTSDDCAIVSRQVSAVLDVEELIADQYRLEVSSPGLDRPLFGLSDFERFIGEIALVCLIRPIDGRKNFQGRLERIENSSVVIHCEDRDFVLPMHQIAKANLVPKL